MSDDVTDGVDVDEPWILQETSDHACAEEPSDAMDEGLETSEKEQKILAKIVCVPGKMTFVAAWMKKFFATVFEADEKAKIRTTNEQVIKSLKEFPEGQKFSEAFKPDQSDDMKLCKNGFPRDNCWLSHRSAQQH
jgi:hypothetical protein